MSIIEARNLHKHYKQGNTVVKALNGVSFDVEKGEFVAIIGPSGSGKSTLLNLIAGLEPPTKGTIKMAGKQIENYTENQLVAFRRMNVGFIFQSYNLLNTMNAVENVALPLAFRGIGKEERNRLARKYLELVGLGDRMNNMASDLSGGQQQRVGIARALVCKPKIIFADEPTGNLDSKSTMDILHLLQDIVKENKQTLVMVTHDPNVSAYADRRIRIVDGMIDNSEEGAT